MAVPGGMWQLAEVENIFLGRTRVVQVGTIQVSKAAAAQVTWKPQVSPAENQPPWLSHGPLPPLRALLIEAGDC